MEKLRKYLYYIILFIFIKGVLIKFLGNKDVFDLMTDVLVFYIAYKVPRGEKGEVRSMLGKGVVWATGTFLFVGLLADLINLVPPLTVLWGVRMFARYFLLLYAIIKLCDAHDVGLFKGFLYRMFKWNVIACVVEFLLGRMGDSMGGTFVGNGQLILFLMICLILFTVDYFNRSISLVNFLIRIASVFVIAMWAEIKLLYFFVPLCVYTGYVLIRKFSIGHIITLTMAYFLLIPVMQFALSFYFGEKYVNDVFDRDYVEQETHHDGYNLAAIGRSFNRGTCIIKAESMFLQDPTHYYLGHGIGSGTNSGTFGTWIKQRYEDTAYFFFTSSYVLIETGWIGYIAFLLIYLFITIRFWKSFWHQEDDAIRYWAALGMMMGLFTFMLIWYNDRPYADYYLPFILWAFCLLAIERKGKETDEDEAEETNNPVFTELTE